jgi:hypothetical protein
MAKLFLGCRLSLSTYARIIIHSTKKAITGAIVVVEIDTSKLSPARTTKYLSDSELESSSVTIPDI